MDINLAEFPKSREKVREIVKAQLVTIQAEMAKQIPKEMEFELPEIIPQQIDLTIEYLLKNNFRFLYDVFDANNIFLEINTSYSKIKDERFFSVAIDNEVVQNGVQAAVYSSRLEAEISGFKECFKILEEKL